MEESLEFQFALCIEKGCEDLEKRKLYQVLPDETAIQEGYLRVMDESGEDYLYPEFHFVLVELPRRAQEALMVAGQVAVPDLDAIRAFAARLHAEGQAWEGEAFGWPAEYHPERPDPPLDSKMTFTPADFCIGESGIWFFSLMWEHGRDAEPAAFLDNTHLLAGGERADPE